MTRLAHDGTLITKWVVPVTEPSFAVTVTAKLPVDVGVPVIFASVEFGTDEMVRPGTGVMLYASELTFLVSRPTILIESGDVVDPVWVPGSTSVTRVPFPIVNAPVPFGVPSPVGPS